MLDTFEHVDHLAKSSVGLLVVTKLCSGTTCYLCFCIPKPRGYVTQTSFVEALIKLVQSDLSQIGHYFIRPTSSSPIPCS